MVAMKFFTQLLGKTIQTIPQILLRILKLNQKSFYFILVLRVLILKNMKWYVQKQFEKQVFWYR